jgi:hypothetical protein
MNPTRRKWIWANRGIRVRHDGLRADLSAIVAMNPRSAAGCPKTASISPKLTTDRCSGKLSSCYREAMSRCIVTGSLSRFVGRGVGEFLGRFCPDNSSQLTRGELRIC